MANYRNNRTIKESIDFAKEKALTLKNREMIRLFADDNFDYYIYREDDTAYIGSFVNSTLDKEMNQIYKNKEVIYMLNDKGVQTMKLQRLFRKNTFIA